MAKKACSFIGSKLSNFSFGYDNEAPKCAALKEQLSEYINNMHSEGVRDFYSACQEGVELWAADMVTRLMKKDSTVKLHIIMPFEEQANKWHSDTREMFFNVHAAATDCKILNTRYNDSALETARREAVDNSEYIFAAVAGADDEIARLTDYAIQSGKQLHIQRQ